MPLLEAPAAPSVAVADQGSASLNQEAILVNAGPAHAVRDGPIKADPAGSMAEDGPPATPPHGLITSPPVPAPCSNVGSVSTPDAAPGRDLNQLPHTCRPGHDPLMQTVADDVRRQTSSSHPADAPLAVQPGVLPGGSEVAGPDRSSSPEAVAADAGEQEPHFVGAQGQPPAKRQKLQYEAASHPGTVDYAADLGPRSSFADSGQPALMSNGSEPLPDAGLLTTVASAIGGGDADTHALMELAAQAALHGGEFMQSIQYCLWSCWHGTQSGSLIGFCQRVLFHLPSHSHV